MHIYDDEVFTMACDQFAVIADYLNIDKNDRDRLMYPKRAMAVTLPVTAAPKPFRVTGCSIT